MAGPKFRIASVASRALAGTLAIRGACLPASAANCEADMRPTIQAAVSGSDLQGSLTNYLTPLLRKPRYFEGRNPSVTCTSPHLDQPLYAGIPVRECTYTELGLKGWVMLSTPSAELVSKWVTHACNGMPQATACAVRLTTYAWCSNQLSFPIAGNIIEDGSSGGGKGSSGVNYVFLHGVTIARPDWMPEGTSVDLATQKERLGAMALTEHAYTGSVAEVSRPSGIRREIYSKYAQPIAVAGKPLDVGKSCPVPARRAEWLDVSRDSYVEAWRDGRNRLFDAAAKALMAGEFPGVVPCKIGK